MKFAELGLSADLLRAVDEQGYTDATPVQAKAIPRVLAGEDIMASAQTGTGKTAAFTLPLLHRLASAPAAGGGRPVRALVLTPTRELAAQVQENIQAYSRHQRLRSLSVFGGVSINPQISRLQRGVDMLVATPGRLIDLLQRRAVSLRDVECLVLDEADRMLDMGFRPAIEKILRELPSRRQTLLFSATFSAEITQLAKKFMRDPQRVETAVANSTVEAIQQRAIRVDQARKRELLSYMIGKEDWHQVLVFTRTKHGANRLATQLSSDGLPAAAIHGNKSQGARTKALADFKNNRVRVLVATDIAARGLDIAQLPYVVNYEMPQVAEDYVHRIGRTGRAGNLGLALSLVAPAEQGLLGAVRRMTRQDLSTELVDGFEPTESASSGVARNGGGRGRPAGGGRSGGGRASAPRASGGSRDGRSGASGNASSRRPSRGGPRRRAA